MKQLQTRSTSRSSAVCDPIVVREGEHVRLAFIPSLVDNPSNPRASVNGTFVYQRKAASEKWIPLRTLSLSSLRDGDQFKLTLHADELFNLLQKLVPLYKLYETKGVPKGQKMFVEVSPGMAKLVTAGEKDLGKLIESHPEDAAELLIMYGPPRACKGNCRDEVQSAQMYPSIRAKALSRANFSLLVAGKQRSEATAV